MTENMKLKFQNYLNELPGDPGVYRMISENNELLYVGKAKNLKRRVSSYFKTTHQSSRIQRMVNQIDSIEITITRTEAEALLLENNLIKSLKPKYNILLRDDKSYPYIKLSGDSFPRLSFYRGNTRSSGEYYGPYPSVSSVKETVRMLQKLFRLRTCRNSDFSNRSRPCLQYQIKRCSAPCVGLINQKNYEKDCYHAGQFLKGNANELISNLIREMDEHAHNLDFENAARVRDLIRDLRKISEQQFITSNNMSEIDILALDMVSNEVCVQVAQIRNGQHLGGKNFFPKIPLDATPDQVIQVFIGMYYLDKEPPSEILVNYLPTEPSLLEEMFRLQFKKKCLIKTPVREEKRRWIDMAERNAKESLLAKLRFKMTQEDRWASLEKIMNLKPNMINRLECFDISHTRGELTVASCVVFDRQGPVKNDYRRFNIEGIKQGDDYGAMKQVLYRRFTSKNLHKKSTQDIPSLPDILVIDGGKGQISQAQLVLNELNIKIKVLGVTKGEGRRAVNDHITVSESTLNKGLELPSHSPALHLLQQIRDEAHRFAIGGHRNRRARQRNQSILESIPGLGPKRRQLLLKHFGGLQGLVQASSDEISKVPGIGTSLASLIHEYLHI